MALSQGSLILASDVYKSRGTLAKASDVNATPGTYITLADLKKQIQDIDYLEFRLVNLYTLTYDSSTDYASSSRVSSLSDISGYGTLSITNNSNGTSGKIVASVNTTQNKYKGIDAEFACYAHFKSDSSRVVGYNDFLSKIANGTYDNFISYNISVTGAISYQRYSGSGSWNIYVEYILAFIDDFISSGNNSFSSTFNFSNSNHATNSWRASPIELYVDVTSGNRGKATETITINSITIEGITLPIRITTGSF